MTHAVFTHHSADKQASYVFTGTRQECREYLRQTVTHHLSHGLRRCYGYPQTADNVTLMYWSDGRSQFGVSLWIGTI